MTTFDDILYISRIKEFISELGIVFLIRLSNVNRPLFESSFKTEYWRVFKCSVC